jgi:hypothetical protein
MTEFEELEKAIEKHDRYVEMFDSDTFKEFYEEIMEIGEDLGKTLVFNYNALKKEKKDAITNQMCFISGLKNYVEGRRGMREHLHMEKESYLAAQEEELNDVDNTASENEG